MILYINTAEDNQIAIGLAEAGDVVKEHTIKVKFEHAEKLLPLIDQLLQSNNITAHDLTGVLVVSGPGGFTALRIGVLAANTLGFALDIPVVGLQKDQFKAVDDFIAKGEEMLKNTPARSIVVPEYGKEPNITLPKKSKLKVA